MKKKLTGIAVALALVLSLFIPVNKAEAQTWSAKTKDYSITITKEWYRSTYVYAAHIKLNKSGYGKFGTVCAKNRYGATETTLQAAQRQGAVFAVNGDYASPELKYPVARMGKLIHDHSATSKAWCPGIYNRWTGIFQTSKGELAYRNQSKIVKVYSFPKGTYITQTKVCIFKERSSKSAKLKTIPKGMTVSVTSPKYGWGYAIWTDRTNSNRAKAIEKEKDAALLALNEAESAYSGAKEALDLIALKKETIDKELNDLAIRKAETERDLSQAEEGLAQLSEEEITEKENALKDIEEDMTKKREDLNLKEAELAQAEADLVCAEDKRAAAQVKYDDLSAALAVAKTKKDVTYKGYIWLPGCLLKGQKSNAKYIKNKTVTYKVQYQKTKPVTGSTLKSLISKRKVSDTFIFGPAFDLSKAVQVEKSKKTQAQRTFIGSNGNPGDIWVCVSEGRYNDGKSKGLTYKECARFLQNKGCISGIPLDGGGSSTMVFKNTVLNQCKGGKKQRAVKDFVILRR